MKTKRAKDVPQGKCFRKKTGTVVYLRISESSQKFAKMDENFVWGVAHNGNLAHVKPDAQVFQVPLSSLMDVQCAEDDWHEVVCGGRVSEDSCENENEVCDDA